MSIFNFFRGKVGSGKVARDRLQFVLMHDRSDISPEIIENMREDMLAVIERYVEIDRGSIDIQFEREDSSFALVANVPVRMVRRAAQTPAAEKAV